MREKLSEWFNIDLTTANDILCMRRGNAIAIQHRGKKISTLRYIRYIFFLDNMPFLDGKNADFTVMLSKSWPKNLAVLTRGLNVCSLLAAIFRVNNATRTNIVSEFILRRARIKRIIVGRYGGSYIAEAGSSGGDNSSDSSNSNRSLRGWLINVRCSALALAPNFLSSLSTIAMAVR